MGMHISRRSLSHIAGPSFPVQTRVHRYSLSMATLSASEAPSSTASGVRASMGGYERLPEQENYSSDGPRDTTIEMAHREEQEPIVLAAPEPTESPLIGYYWLALWFAFNLGLTIYNKMALGRFPYPWTLTCIHALCSSLGSKMSHRAGMFETGKELSTRDTLTLWAFSTLYTINIATSNISLALVSVPVHQTVRSTTPLFAIVLSVIYLHQRYSLKTYFSLLPVVVGVCFATYGDYSFTTWGLLLTLAGAALAGVKAIATSQVMRGNLKLSPMDLLMRMSPMAFVQCFAYATFSGETADVWKHITQEGGFGAKAWLFLLINGAIAFGLNVASFTANKKTGALTMCVAANIKQVVTIMLAVVAFNLHINPINGFGIAVTIAGGAWYSYVEYERKRPISPPTQEVAMAQVLVEKQPSQ